jgi:hypothetical protein
LYSAERINDIWEEEEEVDGKTKFKGLALSLQKVCK